MKKLKHYAATLYPNNQSPIKLKTILAYSKIEARRLICRNFGLYITDKNLYLSEIKIDKTQKVDYTI